MSHLIAFEVSAIEIYLLEQAFSHFFFLALLHQSPQLLERIFLACEVIISSATTNEANHGLKGGEIVQYLVRVSLKLFLLNHTRESSINTFKLHILLIAKLFRIRKSGQEKHGS